MTEVLARIETRNANAYIRGLAEAWDHSYPVRVDAMSGEIELPGAQLIMTADPDWLTLRLVGSDAQRVADEQLRVARHLDHLAGADAPQAYEWHAL